MLRKVKKCMYINSLKGLSGIDLGNLLIKQSVNQIMQLHPSIKTICTLSPIPNFVPWLKSEVNHSLLKSCTRIPLLLDTEWKRFHSDEIEAYKIFQVYFFQFFLVINRKISHLEKLQ